MSYSDAELNDLIEEATVDCYNDDEQGTGLYTMIDDYVGFPFTTTVPGVNVTVEGVDIVRGHEIVTICRRDSERQVISLVDLPLPSPSPGGAKCIAAYRKWADTFWASCVADKLSG